MEIGAPRPLAPNRCTWTTREHTLPWRTLRAHYSCLQNRTAPLLGFRLVWVRPYVHPIRVFCVVPHVYRVVVADHVPLPARHAERLHDAHVQQRGRKHRRAHVRAANLHVVDEVLTTNAHTHAPTFLLQSGACGNAQQSLSANFCIVRRKGPWRFSTPTCSPRRERKSGKR